VSLAGGARPALGVPDLPLRRVPSGDRLQLFAGLEGDIGDVYRGDVELVQRPVAVRVDLDRIDVAGACRFDASVGVGELDATNRITVLGRCCRPAARHPLELAGQLQQLGHLNCFDGFGRFRMERCRIVVIDVQNLGSAGGQRQQRDYPQCDCVPHPLPPSSRDQAIASM
jgi:hypothetical protein